MKKPTQPSPLDIELSITKEENQSGLVRLLRMVEQARLEGTLDLDKSIQLEKDIRVKLNAQFDMEQSEKEKRIIVVPRKHLYICPHTNRECSNMPPKEVCMKYYDLVERNEDSK